MLLDTLKFLGGPAGPLALLVISAFIAVGFLYVWPRSRRLAKIWVLWVSGVYLVLGLPVVANAIARGLPTVARLHDDRDPIHTLIVLDGDNRRGRLQETLRALATHHPPELWVVGDEWLVEGLIDAGYPRETYGHVIDRINTREQMAWVRELIETHPGVRPAIVASRLQTPRIAALARAADLDVTLLPSPIDIEPPVAGWRRFLPTYAALRTSRDAIYELAALFYYRRQGWIE